MALLSLRKTAAHPDVEDGQPLYQWPDPAKPSAVLVPSLVREHRIQRRTRKTVLAVVATAVTGSILAAGGSVWWASTAATERGQAQAEVVAAKAEVAKYMPIATYYDDLWMRKEALNAELAGDIAFSEVTKTVMEATPKYVELTRIGVMPGAPCASPDPFEPTATLGCIQISAAASKHYTPAVFVKKLNDLPESSGLVDAFAGSLSATNGQLTFSVSVNYTDQVLTHRFVPEGTNPDGTVAPNGQTATTTSQGETP